ncbi:hypothetical protein [Heyndrickxia oleronia]|uniref:hypothetical protein n=1 Tax=Heyndrickxia oleronia TaxID=38875 RepID=UPI00203FBE4F|nr:hypothetical protein [Heyndrickxia oleronia]
MGYVCSNWWRCKGTAYEPGIDDQTKARLMDEIKKLKNENDNLKEIKYKLEEQLGILPF